MQTPRPTSIYLEAQAHGFTEHYITEPAALGSKTICGVTLTPEKNARTTEPDTRWSSWYVFTCDRCRKARRKLDAQAARLAQAEQADLLTATVQQ